MMKISLSYRQHKKNLKKAYQRIFIGRSLLVLIFAINIVLIILMNLIPGRGNIPSDLNFQGVVKIEAQNRVGSGFIVDTDLVLTAAHVVENIGNTATVIFRDGTVINAAVIASGFSQFQAYITNPGHVTEGATRHDWALLKLEAQVDVSKIMLLGDSESAKEMDEVLVIGYPGGIKHNVSKGIISGIDAYEIRTDAPIDPGNSGGPLVAIDNKTMIGVIGIVVSIPSISGQLAQSVHAAVPIQIVKDECSKAGYELY